MDSTEVLIFTVQYKLLLQEGNSVSTEHDFVAPPDEK